jgi:nitrite reductase (NADH) large subunit
MKVVIVGNGLAGTMAAKTLRELDSGVGIEIFAEESQHYYPRPNLIEFLAGNLSRERVFAFPENWTVRQKIGLHLGTPVRKILPESGEVVVEGGTRERYDALLLADGSTSFVPPIKGAEKKGVFTLKTLDDALTILDFLAAHHGVAVLGGGLLGLEVARALRTRGAAVEVVEFFDRLLPRQLDPEGASLLRRQIEQTGIKLRLGMMTEEITGGEEVGGLRFKNGDPTSCDMVIIAAGVRPNTALAKEVGLGTDRGVLVDDLLRTSRAGIFAAGDNTQHRGRVYGIIPASFEQARAAAYNMLGQEKPYEGTTPFNTLKVAGIYVTSIGIVNPEAGATEELRIARPEAGIYKKVVLQNGRLAGAIWMGTKKGATEISRAVGRNVPAEAWKHALLEDDFDFAVLG